LQICSALYGFGHANVPLVDPEGPGVTPNANAKKPKSAAFTVQPGIEMPVWQNSCWLVPKAKANAPKSPADGVPV
jgi:hypothetical protein